MLEVRPTDLAPFERLKALATATCASKVLRAFTISRGLYPGDLDLAEARRIHELLCWLVEVSLREPLLAGINWANIPFDPPSLPSWVETVGGAGLVLAVEPLGLQPDLSDPQASAARVMSALESHIAPTLIEVRARVDEILCFDMMFPHPPAEPEYTGAPRALFMFGKYWDSYRAILDQHGASGSEHPHPMVRFVLSLQHRLREYAARVADEELSTALETVLAIEFDSDSQLVWEDWAQPQINRLQRAFEEARIRQRSRSFALTAAEDLFLKTTATHLQHVGREAHAHQRSPLERAAITAPAPVDGNGFAEPVPGFRHSPDFRSVRLNGVRFSLTTQQAQVVEYLLRMHVHDTAAVAQVTILDAIGAGGSELRDSFRGSAAWGTLVVRGSTRGTFRLNL